MSFFLASKTPFGQETYLHFYLRPLGPQRTEVLLHFDNTLTRPSLVIPWVAGIVRWTRKMHERDLAGLRQYVERARPSIAAAVWLVGLLPRG